MESCLQLLVGCFGSVGIELIGTWPFFGSWGGLQQTSKVYCCKDVEKRGYRLDQLSVFHLPSPHYGGF